MYSLLEHVRPWYIHGRGERSQHGHGSYWTKTISAKCYGKNFFFLIFVYARTFNVLEKIFIKIEPLLLLLSHNLKNGPV
jgi:hypothetical protein